jgi:hypothetical protein
LSAPGDDQTTTRRELMTHLRHWTSHFQHRSDKLSPGTYNEDVICPVCRQRRGRRACPALNEQICAICCGTKRLVEIRCPSDCPYLATAREHPAAVVVRQQRQDLGLLVECLRDLNARQSQLFFLMATLIARHKSSELESIVDDDVAQAAGTLAATFETAARGVIYEHRAASIPAARLATALKTALADAASGAGSAFERDAAAILRRIEQAARRTTEAGPPNSRAFIALLERAVQHPDDTPPESGNEPRLIVP